MQITWCTTKDNKNVQSQYLLCPGTGNLVCGQTVNIPTTCVKKIFFSNEQLKNLNRVKI